MNDTPRILIVDDERFHLNVMADLLSNDYKVLVAKSGARALEIAAFDPAPDLILLDILMPEMDGYEVCRRLKMDEKTRHIPVIFLTVKSDVADETYGFGLGAVDYITKPFSPPIVKARVSTQLALGRALWDLEQENDRLEQRVRERTQEIVRAQEAQERLQLRLQRAHKMESIGLLAGGIAHDFNSILTAVSGFADLALFELQSGNYEVAIENTEDVRSACDNASGLVKQLLAFTRGVPAKPQLLQPAVTLKETIKLLRPLLPSMIRFEVALDKELPAILFDKVQMHQVVMNLCINARDAMNCQGHLTVGFKFRRGIETECDACHNRVRGDFVELEVSDDGVGMSPEQVKHVFEPFFSTKEAGNGTGMGMSVVNDIMHNHHGHVLVETAPEKGTSFKLLFAVAGEADTGVVGDDEDQAGNSYQAAAGSHILVVQEDLSVAVLLKELLDASGYRVTTYHDALKAWEEIKAHPDLFDLLIADQNLPNMSGFELARAINEATIRLEVIVCMDNAGAVAQIESRKGVTRVLRKPVQSEQLLQEMQRLLSPARMDQ